MLTLGTKLGPYEILAPLGAGGMGEVYRARDTALLQHINPNPAALAAELEKRITPQNRVEWKKGSIEDWVMEGHRLAQAVAYGHLSNENRAPITPAYERQADVGGTGTLACVQD